MSKAARIKALKELGHTVTTRWSNDDLTALEYAIDQGAISEPITSLRSFKNLEFNQPSNVDDDFETEDITDEYTEEKPTVEDESIVGEFESLENDLFNSLGDEPELQQPTPLEPNNGGSFQPPTPIENKPKRKTKPKPQVISGELFILTLDNTVPYLISGALNVFKPKYKMVDVSKKGKTKQVRKKIKANHDKFRFTDEERRQLVPIADLAMQELGWKMSAVTMLSLNLASIYFSKMD